MSHETEKHLSKEFLTVPSMIRLVRLLLNSSLETVPYSFRSQEEVKEITLEDEFHQLWLLIILTSI
jgi:hypothetical protein